ncbi:MAG: UTP--glucose-1-phosphate uridylyltransferase [Lachnospiraceae bacterium]|nr:UTP--glucose-1-phosphate uridylyltransferase [Lachnospiraceae bacterium]
MTVSQAQEKLKKYDQEHLLTFYEDLSEHEKETLLAQISEVDLSYQKAAVAAAQGGFALPRGEIAPIAVRKLSQIALEEAEYRRIGLDAIKQGKLGAILLAGGMGSRLGSDGPKGVYNIGTHKELSIFECLFQNLMDVVRESGTWITLFVMTSDKNHEETVRFLTQHRFFGYDEARIHFFKQTMTVATDYEGKVLLEEKGRISTSPSGNGGWYLSMRDAGLLDVVSAEGIEWLNVFAVDNVLQRIADPCFLGATIQDQASVGAKVFAKCAKDERIGIMCLEDGKPSIIEYYDMTDDLADAKDANGEWLYQYGVILNYLFRESELRRIVDQSLPLHVVNKKIQHIDKEGRPVNPTEPNGYRYETLVLDMIHELGRCLPYEVVREKEFAPIKNLTGIDSVETARALLQKDREAHLLRREETI